MAICQQRPSIMRAMIVSDAIDTLPYGLTRGLAGVVAEMVSFTAGRTSCQHDASNLPTVRQQMGMAGPPVRHLEAHSLPAPSLPGAGRSQGTLAPHFGAPHAGRSASHAPPRRRRGGYRASWWRHRYGPTFSAPGGYRWWLGKGLWRTCATFLCMSTSRVYCCASSTETSRQ